MPHELRLQALRFAVPGGDDVGMFGHLLTLLLLATTAMVVRAADDVPMLSGVVVGVVDGDTADIRLDSGMIRVRLHAIDAPERGQPQGAASKAALAALVYGKPVLVEPIEQDRYDRLVARLWLGDLDVNAEMLKQGQAWVYRRYAGEPAYCAYEKAARDLRRGLWALPESQRPAPWEWRKRKSLSGGYTDYSAQTVAECVASLGR